jgi:glycosyltransferase involved in cell wall biosynthesis
MSIIESLASSLPVIVSRNVANYREIEEDNCGLLVDTELDAMVNLLVEVENSKSKNEIYANNSDISAKKRYDIRIVAESMKANYNRILNE